MTFKYLIVGDPHVTPASIPECEKLFDLIVKTARENHVKEIILLGDLFDTHAIIHASVLNFYFNQFWGTSDLRWIALVGNHDITLRDRHNHALMGFKNLPNVTVIDKMTHFEDFDAIPYTDNDEFVKITEEKRSDTLICHHEFLGSHYENGFYSSHGIDLKHVKYQQVISGHVHKKQSFGPINYLGAPRWIHSSDANQPRGLHLWDGKKDFKFIDTADTVGKIIEIKLNESSELPQDFNHNLYKKIIIRASGRPKFIEEITQKYLGKAEIVPNITQNEESTVSESLGVNEALKKFVLNDYKIQHSQMTNEKLYKTISEKLQAL